MFIWDMQASLDPQASLRAALGYPQLGAALPQTQTGDCEEQNGPFYMPLTAMVCQNHPELQAVQWHPLELGRAHYTPMGMQERHTSFGALKAGQVSPPDNEKDGGSATKVGACALHVLPGSPRGWA